MVHNVVNVISVVNRLGPHTSSLYKRYGIIPTVAYYIQDKQNFHDCVLSLLVPT